MARGLGLRAPFLVLGLARAGRAAVAALSGAAGPAAVRAWDAFDGDETRRRVAALRAEGVAATLGPWRDELLAGAGTVVRSPGIALDAAPLRAARAAGIDVIDELDLGHRRSRRELLAVTGTDGKSTVCALLAAAAGGDAPLPVAGNTEIGLPLSAVAPAGGPLVVEVSSYQLELCPRPWSRLAVLTNLTPEHLHRHGTMAAYGAAKRRLFIGGGTAVERAVVNVDGDFGRGLAAELRAAGAAVATFSAGDTDADYRVLGVASHADGAVLRARAAGPDITLAPRLPGRHNAANVLAALAACDLLGVPRARSEPALEATPGVPGRWEHVRAGQPFAVVVDFAHTPAGLRALLRTAREALAPGPEARVHLMLSAGSVMSAGKRRAYGRVAGELADRVIATEGSWAGPPQAEVAALVAEGARAAGHAAVAVVVERREAIREALAGAAPGDAVLVVGRGSRTVLTRDPNGGGVHFDDRAVAREELARLGAATPAPAG